MRCTDPNVEALPGALLPVEDRAGDCPKGIAIRRYALLLLIDLTAALRVSNTSSLLKRVSKLSSSTD